MGRHGPDSVTRRRRSGSNDIPEPPPSVSAILRDLDASSARDGSTDTEYWTAITTPSDLSTVEQLLPTDVTTSLFAFLGDRLRAHPGTYLCNSLARTARSRSTRPCGP